MKRMISTAYEDLTLSEAQYEALTSTGSVQLDFSEYPEGLARLHNSNVITIYTSPDHSGKNIVLKRQTQTETKAIFAAIEKDNSTLKEYSIEVTLPVNGEGGAVNIGLADILNTPVYWHSITLKRIDNNSLIYYFDLVILSNRSEPFTVTSFMEWYGNNPLAQVKIVQGYRNGQGNAYFSSYLTYYSSTILTANIVNISTGAVESSNASVSDEVGTVLEDVVNRIH